jgi:hypothetical protein
MHDINPLGTTMHLRELDRQVSGKFRAVHRPSRSIRAALSAMMVAFSGAAVLAWFGDL